jgi:signal transduction histidine kinase
MGEGDAVAAAETDEVAELRASRRRLVLAADAERREIERALHDGLQQQLVGVATDLELASISVGTDPKATAERLADLRRDLQEALEQSRALASRIYPPLDAGGLVVALRSAAANADVPSRIEVDGALPLPPEFTSAVYFGFVEILERAPSGTSVAITVREEHGALAFELTAEGDVDAQALPLRDRVEALGGELTIRSGPGGRTSWLGTLPLSR